MKFCELDNHLAKIVEVIQSVDYSDYGILERFVASQILLFVSAVRHTLVSMEASRSCTSLTAAPPVHFSLLEIFGMNCFTPSDFTMSIRDSNLNMNRDMIETHTSQLTSIIYHRQVNEYP